MSHQNRGRSVEYVFICYPSVYFIFEKRANYMTWSSILGKYDFMPLHMVKNYDSQTYHWV